jgi:MoaA/NifB/PqqE/SkfB family radical SAM enzyme
MLYQQIDQVQFDLNVTCNAFCPGCHRYTILDDQMYLNPFLSFNTSLDLEIIEQTMINKRIVDRPWVDFVGLVGDPIAHPKFIEIIDIIYKHKPNAHINIHTNGGLKSPQFFEELATKLKNNQTLLQFSVDGLEDTNNIYRIGVSWKKIMENMTAFIDAGGNAIWKFIVFPWNKHQVDEAKILAESMGIEFQLEKNRDENSPHMLEYMEASEHINKKTKGPLGYKSPHSASSFNKIQNKCFDPNGIYINQNGRVLPCCMFNASLSDEQYRDEMLPYINEDNENWNNLQYNTLEDIMNNKWWRKLYDHLDTAPCTVCIHSCEKR